MLGLPDAYCGSHDRHVMSEYDDVADLEDERYRIPASKNSISSPVMDFRAICLVRALEIKN